MLLYRHFQNSFKLIQFGSVYSNILYQFFLLSNSTFYYYFTVPNSHNITQTYNTKINKYLELSVAMRNLWCLEKISILPFIISATGIVPQSLLKNLKILDLENTLVVEIQKGILLYSCHIVRKFLNIDTEHKTQKSQNAEARRR
jgi:hypothetical protein